MSEYAAVNQPSTHDQENQKRIEHNMLDWVNEGRKRVLLIATKGD
jgi:hypothetical protein